MVEASLAVLMADKAVQAFVGLFALIIGMQFMDDADGVLIVFLISQLVYIGVTEFSVKVVAALI